MIIERIKKSFEFQRRSVHGPVPLWGVLNGIFILYPIVFVLFWAVGAKALKNPFLYNGLVIAGVVTWVLNLVFLLDYRRGILTSFGSYLMYLTSHFYTIIDFNVMSGDYNFIGLKLSLPLIYTLVIIVVMSSLVELDSKEIISEKSMRNVINFVMVPPLILSTCLILLAAIGYEFFWGWGASILSMIFGPYLYRTWFYIIYAYQHRNDLNPSSTISSLEVPSKLIQNQEFDKDRFKKNRP